MNGIAEHALVVLTRDLPDARLRAGDIGTIVFCYPDADAYEVEFSIAGRAPLDPLTVTGEDVRPLAAGEILHARATS